MNEAPKQNSNCLINATDLDTCTDDGRRLTAARIVFIGLCWCQVGGEAVLTLIDN